MLTVIKFYADWCGPCKAMMPTMNQIKEDYKNKVIFTDVNIDDNPQLRVEHGIRSIPAFVILKDELEVSRKIGSATLSELKEFIDEYRGV